MSQLRINRSLIEHLLFLSYQEIELVLEKRKKLYVYQLFLRNISTSLYYSKMSLPEYFLERFIDTHILLYE